MNAILWNDTETTGTEPKTCAIIQLAAAVEIDGEIVETFNKKMRPHDGATIDNKALAVSGHTAEEVMEFDKPGKVYVEFRDFLARHNPSMTKLSRYIPGGYNNRFDLDFISAWFTRQSGGPYAFWDHLQYNPIDPLPSLVMLWRYGKIPTVDCKLGTMCEHFNIKIEAHDALSDLLATRKLSRIVFSRLSQEPVVAVATETAGADNSEVSE